MSVTFAEIENAISAQLIAAGLSMVEVDLPEVLSGRNVPSFHCRMTKCELDIIGKKIKYMPTMSVFVIIKNINVEKVRRQTIYPLLHGVIGAISFQKLSLAIADIMPINCMEIDLSEFENTGLKLYQIDFKTSFYVDITQAEAIDMLSLAVKYYLTPGSATADAEDDVDLT
jgi:hypothetical protein